jgi:hypothetical protein
MNSDLNEDVSMLICFFENQYIGAEFSKMIKPVHDLRVTLSLAWSESAKAHMVKPIPHRLGVLGGSSSKHVPYTVADQSSLGNFVSPRTVGTS